MRNAVALHKRRDKRGFEKLEERRMMAGDVWAGVVNGFLLIRGDSKDNVICIEGVDDKIKISGIKTNIKGQDCFYLDDIDCGIWIDMKGGCDDLKIKNLEVPGRSLKIQLGSGDDKLLLECVTTCGDVCIYGDSGKDYVTIKNSCFNGSVGIWGCDGDDKVDVSDVDVNGAMLINTDGGNDWVNLCDVRIKCRGLIEADHSAEDASVATAGGFDKDWFKKLAGCRIDICCGLEIKTGKDKDTVNLKEVCVDAYTWIDTDGGNDCIDIKDSKFGNQLRFANGTDGGAGGAVAAGAEEQEDCCEQDQSGLGIQSGTGDDKVNLCDVKVFGTLLIDTTGSCLWFLNGKAEKNDAAIASNKKKTWADGNDCVTLTRVCVLPSCDFFPTENPITSQDEFEPSECCGWGTLAIFTGNGCDKVLLDCVDTFGWVLISTTDFCKLDGADVVKITNSCLNFGGGLDMQITEASQGGGYRCIGLIIWTGAGDDCVTICDVKVQGGVKICTDGGKDKVWIEKLCADSIYCDTGSGDDWLGIRWSDACWVCVDGGYGKDTFACDDNDFDRFFKKDFEYLTS